MRIYQNAYEAVRETERDLFELGITVPVQTMQDKQVAGDENYETKEVRGYAFKIDGWTYNREEAQRIVEYVFKSDSSHTFNIMRYMDYELMDRLSGQATNPGKAYTYRKEIWSEFLHHGRFAYTYSERMAPQLEKITNELKDHPGTRQAIINIHSNICPTTQYPLKEGEATMDEHIAWQNEHPELAKNMVTWSSDMHNTGGHGRIPCSMYYQFMVREGKLDLIYTMRSCDFLTHFPVDLLLALRMQCTIAQNMTLGIGYFTYFTGSLHAYHKDLKTRGIF